MVKILLLADYSRESERRLLRGLVSYANTRGGCILHQMSSFPLESRGHSAEILDAARTLDVDAVFGTWMDPDEKTVKELGKPVFIRTIDEDFPSLPMLSGRYNEIGEMAADFFIRQHYESVAFVGFKGILWSDDRFRGFSDRLKQNDISAESIFVRDAMKERDRLSEWLSDLPRPVGIFACNDVMARTVSEVCQFAGINIPEDVALLGADNDEFLCNISYPGISSVNLDFESQGYHLGEKLFEMVEKGSMWPIRIPIEPTGIVERASTIRHRTSDQYVLAALDFMDRNFCSDIDISDVVATIPLSRRAIELRFRKEMAPYTMSSYLSSLRVEKMAALLIQRQDLPISQAAEMSGFRDPSNVWRIFLKFKGLTPSAYRISMNKSHS